MNRILLSVMLFGSTLALVACPMGKATPDAEPAAEEPAGAEAEAEAVAESASEAEAPPPAEEGSPVFSLGIPAPLGGNVAEEQAQFIRDDLRAVFGAPIEVAVHAHLAELAAKLAAGELDVAWLSSLTYVSIRSRGVVPLVQVIREGKPTYRSVLIVREDTEADVLADLEGKRLAWQGTHSASGGLFPRLLFKTEQIEPASFFGELQELPNHDAVCRAVIEGTADVGTTFSDAGERLVADGCAEIEGMDQLKVIATFGPIPGDLVVARAGLPEHLTIAIRDAFLQMEERASGWAGLTGAYFAQSFAQVEEDSLAAFIELVEPLLATEAEAEIEGRQAD